MDDLETFQTGYDVSSGTSGVGITLCSLRSANTSIISAQSTNISTIAKWLAQFNSNPWLVCGIYPNIEVIHVSDAESLQDLSDSFSTVNANKSFERRIDAERHRLERIISVIINNNSPAERYKMQAITINDLYWLSDEDKQIYITTKDQLDTLEVDHPEWLI